MFSTEIKETVYIAITCILVAAVLGFVAFILDVRGDLASTQNDLIATRTDMEAYREYNRYQNAILYGEDVIEVIRRFANTDIAVYVKGMGSDTKGLEDEAGTKHAFYMDRRAYIANPEKYAMDALELGVNCDLSGGVKRDTTYFSYLVYGLYNENDIKKEPYTEDGADINYTEVTAIVITRVGSGRHSYAVNQGDCGCTDGVCTASEIYQNVNNIRGTN